MDRSRNRDRDFDHKRRPLVRSNSRSKREESRFRERDSKHRKEESRERSRDRSSANAKNDRRNSISPERRPKGIDRGSRRDNAYENGIVRYGERETAFQNEKKSGPDLNLSGALRMNKGREFVSVPEAERWGRVEDVQTKEENTQEEVIYKPNFGLSGALAKDKKTGNMVNGVVLKWSEPMDAMMPDLQWRLYVFKGDEIAETLHIHRQKSFLFGRDHRVADVVTAHPSCSLQHAVIQFRCQEKRTSDGEQIQVIRPYLLDLRSTHKTYLNEEPIEDSRYYELKEKDVIRFGGSTREYVLLNDISDNF